MALLVPKGAAWSINVVEPSTKPVMLMFALPMGVPSGVAFKAAVSGRGGGAAGVVAAGAVVSSINTGYWLSVAWLEDEPSSAALTKPPNAKVAHAATRAKPFL